MGKKGRAALAFYKWHARNANTSSCELYWHSPGLFYYFFLPSPQFALPDASYPESFENPTVQRGHDAYRKNMRRGISSPRSFLEITWARASERLFIETRVILIMYGVEAFVYMWYDRECPYNTRLIGSYHLEVAAQ